MSQITFHERVSVKTAKRQTGSAHVVIIIILVVAVIGLLGFVFWQNFISKKTNTSVAQTSQSTDSKQVAQDTTKATTTTTPTPAVADNSSYVVIDTWGVKFPKATDGTTIQWAADSDGGIGFTTSHLTADSVCSAANGAAGNLTRSKDKIGTSIGTTVTPLNNNEPINGYYYGFELPNGQHCSNTNPSDYDEAVRIQGLIKTLSAV